MKILNKQYTDIQEGFAAAINFQNQFEEKYAGSISQINAAILKANKKNVEEARKKADKNLTNWVKIFGLSILIINIPLFIFPSSASESICDLSLVLVCSIIGFLICSLKLMFNQPSSHIDMNSISQIPQISQNSLTYEWISAISQTTYTTNRLTYGSQGEALLCGALADILPDNYIALTNLKVRRNLDADLIVVGPEGLWIFDSKFWSGKVIYHNGLWDHISYHEDDFYEEPDSSVKYAPDKEILDIKGAVQKSLASQCSIQPNLLENLFTMYGIVFTNQNVTFDIQNSPIAWGCTEWWKNQITNRQTDEFLKADTLMGIIDALLSMNEYFQTDEDIQPEKISAVTVAQNIYKNKCAEIQACAAKFNISVCE